MEARELFDRMSRTWLGHPGPLTGEDLAEDVIVEMPFAGFRIQGRQQFLDFANPQRAALPVDFDSLRTVAVHDAVAVAEVVRPGEYQNHAAIQQALT